MRTKKPKRRFETANQIRDEIDKYKAKANKLMDSAAAYDLKADELFKTGNLEVAPDAEFARETAKKRRRSAARIMERRLPKLKDKLAEFATELLPGKVVEDRSVPS
jgi:hypothetical protein